MRGLNGGRFFLAVAASRIRAKHPELTMRPMWRCPCGAQNLWESAECGCGLPRDDRNDAA